MAGGNRFFVAVALDQGGAEIAVRLCIVRSEVYRFPVSRDGFVASMQFEKRISEVVAGLGIVGSELCRLLEIGDRLFVTAELRQRVSHVVMRLGISGRTLYGEGEMSERLAMPGLLRQRNPQQIVRLHHLRKFPHHLLQDRGCGLGVADRQMAVAEVVTRPRGARLLEHLAERLYGFLESILQKKAGAEKSHELDMRRIAAQRHAGNPLRRTGVAALDRVPACGKLILLSFGFSHQSRPMDNENLAYRHPAEREVSHTRVCPCLLNGLILS